MASARVISLYTGRAFEPPVYRDIRGPRASFNASTKQGLIEVQGTDAALGLVLHRTIEENPTHRWGRWVVSDPVSGFRVSAGKTRQGALDDLALKVGYLGGEAALLGLVNQQRLRSR